MLVIKAKKKKLAAIVEVTWADACSNHGWYRDDELKEASLAEMKTVGYLVRRTTLDVALAQGRSEHGKWSEIWVVPAKSVKRVRTISKMR